jgi:hypothetical protein
MDGDYPLQRRKELSFIKFKRLQIVFTTISFSNHREVDLVVV